jgi:hypothetical protein
MSNTVTLQHSDLRASRLESIYERYGAGVYSLCLRLLANEK